MTPNLHDKMLAAIDAHFSASDAVEEEVAENLLLDVRDEINKHKLAAESITEGLRLDDWPKIGCVNHDCDKCKAQQEQEPVAWQPIETAPKDGRMILVCLPRQMNLVVRAWYRDYKGFWLTDQETDGGISRPAWFHEGDLWHPVPPLPGIKGVKHE